MHKKAERGITKRQIRKIHALLHAAELSDREYRLTLFDSFRVDTCKALNYGQAERLITSLEREAIARGNWERYETDAYESLGRRPGMASPAQLRKIEAMWREAMDIRGTEARRKGLRTWLDHHFHVSDMRFLSSAKARKVLHALKVMKDRKESDGGTRRP